mgnify:CR=1 FL=1
MLVRTLDILFSLSFIIIFSWLYILIMLLILFFDGRPILYKSVRVGKNQKNFTCFKYRSMSSNKQISNLGLFLRKSNLDEITQFFNVLIGDMSVVGPRPHDFDEDIYFNQKISNYKERYAVKPGITGLAGINGNRGGTDLNKIQERVNYDITYIRNKSFLLNLKIIFITIYLTLTGKKSI